ncbi:MAG: DUF2062 domain-containing protein [Anaerolineaceae bacterium]|nr:DUF2062 domain-containing protein [Anaerolineaceae bacterium]
MPKKLFRRLIPHPSKQTDSAALRWLAPLISDPYLFQLNRRSVSLAFLVGLFSAFLPIPGQTLVAALLALLVRANLPISAALVWLTNPATMPPLLYLSYRLGSWLLGSPPLELNFHMEWECFTQQGKAILGPLVLGSVTMGVLSGIIGFLGVRGLWRWSVVRNWEARRKRRLLQKLLNEKMAD